MGNKTHGVAVETTAWTHDVGVLETELPGTSKHVVKEASQSVVVGSIHPTAFYVEQARPSVRDSEFPRIGDWKRFWLRPSTSLGFARALRRRWRSLRRSAAEGLQGQVVQAEALDVVVLLLELVEVAFLVADQALEE